jgi:peptidoglycan DL-endopeptidase CwlO
MNRITTKCKRAGVTTLATVLGTIVLSTAVMAAPAETETTVQTTEAQKETSAAAETVTTGSTETQTAEAEDNEYYDANGNIKGKLIISVADEYAEVYEEANITAEVEGKIAKYSVATVVDETEGWYEITSGELEGYVKKSDFAAGKEAEKLDEETSSTKAEITASAVRIREDADTESSVSLVVNKGDKFTVVEEGEEWTKIEVEGVGTGYVETEFINSSEEKNVGQTIEEEQQAEEKIEQAQVKAETVNNGGAANTTEAIETEKALLRAQKANSKSSYEKSEKTDASEEETEAASEETAEENNDNSNETEVSVSSSGSSIGQQVVDYAWSFVGWLPYVWGGADLGSGVDCSGFTMALYAQFGYSLSHDSNAQSCEGISVPLSEAQPGDIIVYSGHVGLYAGDGIVIHAPYPGTVVTADSVYMMEVLDVRRIAY